ncbi:MAG: hypothetical protein GHCLOJNM_03074 [bacterium]|nr:hypothetical protein [bacterium]
MALAPKVARVGVYALATRVPVEAVRKLNEAIAGGHLLYRNPDLFLPNETEPFDIVVVDASHPRAEQIKALYHEKKIKVFGVGKAKAEGDQTDDQQAQGVADPDVKGKKG